MPRPKHEPKTRTNNIILLDGSPLVLGWEIIKMNNYKGYCKSCKKDVPMSIAHMSRRKGIKLKCNLCLSVQTRYMGKRKLEEFKMNTLTKFGGNNTMKFKETLKAAQELTRKDFIDEMRKGFSTSMAGTTSKYDPAYDEAREWKPCKFKDCSGYSLSGTPPKAYLLISNNKIFCKRALSENAFKVFEFEGEPSGSPSLGGKE